MGLTTSFTVQGLNDSTTYYFAVKAYDAEGDLSDASNEVSIGNAIPPVTALSLQANLASPQAPGTPIVWQASAAGGVGPHEFQWAINQGGQWSYGPWTTNASWTWVPPASQTNYTVTVAVAARSAGCQMNGDVSKSSTFTVTAPSTTPPSATPVFVATPSTIQPGQSALLTMTCPTTDCHVIRFNGMLPATYTPVNGQLIVTMPVSPAVTTTYTVSMVKESGAVWAPVSTTVTVAVPVPPSAPASLSAAGATMNQVTLSWADASGDEQGFVIERCAGAGCTSFSQIGQVGPNVSAFVSTGLTPSTTYRHRVRAFNAVGNSAYSNVAEVTTLAPPPPAAPAGLTASAVSPSQIAVSWIDNAGNEQGFRLERCQGSGCSNFAPVVELAANAAAFADSGLAPATMYRYRVVAFNVDGVSTASNVAEAMTLPPPPPAAPNGLAASAASPWQVSLAWIDNAADEAGFTLERCAGAGCTAFAPLAQLGANVIAHVDAGLAPATTYRYRAVAFNNNGVSSSSNIAEARTLPPPPPAAPGALAGAGVSPWQVALSWTDNANDEQGFAIERCQGSGCANFAVVAQVAANAAAFADGGLTPATTYRYRAAAFSSNGVSAYSNVAEVMTLPPPPPAAPSALAGSAPSWSQVALSWSDNASDEQGFAVERCQGPGCTNFAVLAQAAANATSFADSGLSGSTTYRYRVLAFSANGVSAYSNVAELVTPPTGPVLTAQPASLTAGQSTLLTVTCPTTDCHVVKINNVRPTTYQTINGQMVMTLLVKPNATTTYTTSAVTAAGQYWPVARLTVTVTP